MLARIHLDLYRVLGALSSGILLYGITLVYGFTGTTGFSDLAVIIGSSVRVDTLPPVGIVVGLVFIISGLAFKVSAVPFHMWTPDVYEGAPTPVTSFFAVAPKIAAIALFARVLVGPFGDMIAQWQQVIVAISVPRFFTYFIGHGTIVISAAALTLGIGMRPRPWSALHVWLITNATALPVLAVNYFLGSNYMFLCGAPDSSTVLSYLGEWPWPYLLLLDLLALCIMSACYGLYRIGSPRDRGFQRS